MNKKSLTVTIYVGGKRVEALTSDQIDRMAKKLSETMSTYYTANPSSYKLLNEKDV